MACAEKGKSWTGNSTYMWAIANAAYMALMGPQGFREVGEIILQQGCYAAKLLAGIPGVRIVFPSHFFKRIRGEFRRDRQNRSGHQQSRFARKGIFGGKDLSREFPALGQSALYCVTEIHTRGDLDRLAAAIEKIVRS